MEFKILSKKISEKNKPFLIAEISGNHKNSLNRALRLVDEVAKAGFDAIKLQTYKASTMTLKSNSKLFQIRDKKSLWYGKTLHNLYLKASTPWEWHNKIFERAKNKGLIYFSSAFDETSVNFLESLNVPCYKISSFEFNHLPLIKKICKIGKPIILSTGLADLKEIKDVIVFLKKNKCKEFAILKCVSNYPAKIENYNLNSISFLRKKFNIHVGLSDHSVGNVTACAAISLGARIIEKHVTISRNDGAIDSKFSLELKNFRKFVEDCNATFSSLGSYKHNLSISDKKSKYFKRSIFYIKNKLKNQIVSKDDIKIVRPAYGLEPKYFDKVVGKKLKKKIKLNTPVKFSDFYNE